MSEKLDRFVGLLKTIFELDKSDLNFGIYRIMNIRKEQIEDFLTKTPCNTTLPRLQKTTGNTSVRQLLFNRVYSKVEI